MERFVLTDAQWAKMEPHCLGKPTDPEATTAASSKRFFGLCGREARGAIFRRSLATGTLFSSATATGSKRTFSPGFSSPAPDTPDMEYAMVDATIVKVHRHGQGAKGGLRARLSAVPKAA